MHHNSEDIPTFCVSVAETFLSTGKNEESTFDSALKEEWRKAEKNGVFRYILNIRDSKILDGRYRFLSQLNTDRGEKRRTPQDIVSMEQPFNPENFNFIKLAPKEIIMDLGNGKREDIIAVNVSPIEHYHSLLVTERFQQLPQVVTEYSLQIAIKLFFLSKSPYIRVAFNSLCGHASVNHLHWHLYYLKEKMLLEDIDLSDYVGPVQILNDYPAKGFCIKYSSATSITNLVTWTFLIADYLQKKQIAHNIYITRAKVTSTDNEYNDLRIYIWARISCKGVKDTSAFIPAVCELFGHLSIRSEEAYKNLTEDYVVRILKELTDETFLTVTDKIKQVLLDKIKNSSHVIL